VIGSWVIIRVKGSLGAVSADGLTEIPLLIEQSYTDHRHTQVAGGLELVSGDIPEPTGIDRESLAEHKLHAKVHDACQRGVGMRLLKPRGTFEMLAVGARQGCQLLLEGWLGSQSFELRARDGVAFISWETPCELSSIGIPLSNLPLSPWPRRFTKFKLKMIFKIIYSHDIVTFTRVNEVISQRRHSVRRMIWLLQVVLLCIAGSAALAFAADPSLEFTLDQHRFSPEEFRVKANTPFLLVITNKDKEDEECEISSLRIEQIVSGGQTLQLKIPALKPGTYTFVGEFHEKTAKGRIVAE
jgi:hypothetical protein